MRRIAERFANRLARALSHDGRACATRSPWATARNASRSGLDVIINGLLETPTEGRLTRNVWEQTSP